MKNISYFDSSEWKQIKRDMQTEQQNIQKIVLPASFTEKLSELGFPPCINLDEKDWAEAKEKGLEDNDLINFVIAKHDYSKLLSILKNWEDKITDDENLKAILREAIDDYFKEKYYSCTALLVCQYGATINKNESTLKSIANNDEEIKMRISRAKEEQFEKISQSSKKSKKEIQEALNSERNRVNRHLGQYKNFETILFLEYFDDHVYGSKHKGNHPNRPKICHGAKKDFGNQETALKSILCMDIIIMCPQLFNLSAD